MDPTSERWVTVVALFPDDEAPKGKRYAMATDREVPVHHPVDLLWLEHRMRQGHFQTADLTWDAEKDGLMGCVVRHAEDGRLLDLSARVGDLTDGETLTLYLTELEATDGSRQQSD